MLIDAKLEVGDLAIRAYGLENRLRLLQEELSECAVEVNHYFRGRKDARAHLCEEMADVIVMLAEVWPEFGGEVGAWLDKKSVRACARIMDRLKEVGSACAKD